MDIHESYLIFIKIFLFPLWMTYVKKKKIKFYKKKKQRRRRKTREILKIKNKRITTCSTPLGQHPGVHVVVAAWNANSRQISMAVECNGREKRKKRKGKKKGRKRKKESSERSSKGSPKPRLVREACVQDTRSDKECLLPIGLCPPTPSSTPDTRVCPHTRANPPWNDTCVP